jgi:glucosylceramidase
MRERSIFKLVLMVSAFVAFYFAVSCTPQKMKSEANVVSDTISKTYSKVELFVTSKNNNARLADSGQFILSDLQNPDESFPTIMLDPSKTFQTIIGFGGAITDAAAETFYKLGKKEQDEIIRAYYDPNAGIGYTICRTHINSCDFSSDTYAYDSVKDDSSLSRFSIDHDKKFRIPMIKEAIKASNNQLKILATPWSPPSWMKTNNDMLHGGKLIPQYYQIWANYYIRFMQEYQKEGIPTWAISVQNEPAATQAWESCIYTAQDERDFVKNFLGPTLKNSSFSNVKLLVWDHNRGIMYQRAKVIYDDPEAAKYVWGTAFHWYVGDHFQNVKQVHEAFPDKNLLFTEGCTYPFKTENIPDWKHGENYAISIINDLNNSTVGWIDWNIILDETGGPNHVSNFCFAPIIADTKTGKLSYMNSYYYMGHFSKFIRPGAKRIVCSSNDDNLQATAFLNMDKSIAVVVLNSTGTDENFKLWIHGKALEKKILANSIMTLVLL